MKILCTILLFTFLPAVTWLNDFSIARTEAARTHRMILLNFSGSDWCGPCIRFRKEILESSTFESFASDHLVLVRADFPRQKKNQPSQEQIRRNEQLAEKYNSDGKFPYTVLVDENGKPLKSWDGFPNEAPEKFVAEINALLHDNK